MLFGTYDKTVRKLYENKDLVVQCCNHELGELTLLIKTFKLLECLNKLGE